MKHRTDQTLRKCLLKVHWTHNIFLFKYVYEVRKGHLNKNTILLRGAIQPRSADKATLSHPLRPIPPPVPQSGLSFQQQREDATGEAENWGQHPSSCPGQSEQDVKENIRQWLPVGRSVRDIVGGRNSTKLGILCFLSSTERTVLSMTSFLIFSNI